MIQNITSRFANRINFPGQQIRYVHQPLTIDYNGISAAITENGKVIFTKVDEKESTKDEVVYDKMEIPAGLIFKMAGLLKDTRRIENVSTSEVVEEKAASV